MTADLPERRATRRRPGGQAFQVLADENSFPAELSDISTDGLQARVDAMVFDEIRERIDGVRFGNAPPLGVTLRWGVFDGTFGAAFNDRLMAGPIVEQLLAASTDAADPGSD